MAEFTQIAVCCSEEGSESVFALSRLGIVYYYDWSKKTWIAMPVDCDDEDIRA